VKEPACGGLIPSEQLIQPAFPHSQGWGVHREVDVREVARSRL